MVVSVLSVEKFIEKWQSRGDEKSETQKFWLELLSEVLCVSFPTQSIEFEKRVELEHVSFIDGYIPSTRTVIEQKSVDVNLDKAVLQSDGQLMTPYEQAKRYSDWLPDSQRARWIVVCNFLEFRVYDMEEPKAKPEVILLLDLARDWYKLSIPNGRECSKSEDDTRSRIVSASRRTSRKTLCFIARTLYQSR